MKGQLSLLINLIGIALLLFLSACTKDFRQCEEWEIKDASFNTGGCIDWSCGGSRSLQLIFCGESLKDAQAGNTITMSESQCCKRTRTFVRFIRKVD